MNKKFQIFISSTFDDLKYERSKVVETILKSYNFPIGMEMFSADNVEQWEQIKRTIDSSDYYILIIKRRYGTLTQNNICYTEKEYDYAKEKKIPVLGFIASDEASIANRDIERNPKKLVLLEKFIEKVKDNNPCDFWKNCDQLCTQVSQALQKQFEENEREGWIRSSALTLTENIEKCNGESVLNAKKEIDYEIIRRLGDIRLSYDFYDRVSGSFLHSIKKQTYIDNFNREIVLEIQDKAVKVSITTRIDFLNITSGVIYYESSPRFETLEQAESYKHEEFSLNGVECTKEIVSEIMETNDYRQFAFIVKNKFPLDYDRKSIVLLHKTSHTVPIKEFFHIYQLVFPCRNFITTIMLKNDNPKKYRIRTGTFSSFNVHTYDQYVPEFRKNDISTITIGKWSLPGSGYSIVLQEI